MIPEKCFSSNILQYMTGESLQWTVIVGFSAYSEKCSFILEI